jgi:hypothetical protein
MERSQTRRSMGAFVRRLDCHETQLKPFFRFDETIFGLEL